MLKTVEFEGKKFEYDASVIKSYKVIKKIANAPNNVAGFFEACELVFAGKDEEYAEQLNNDFEKLGALVSAAIEAEGGEVKN